MEKPEIIIEYSDREPKSEANQLEEKLNAEIERLETVDGKIPVYGPVTGRVIGYLDGTEIPVPGPGEENGLSPEEVEDGLQAMVKIDLYQIEEKDIDHLFTYHPPTKEDIVKFANINDSSKALGKAIINNTPACALQRQAIYYLTQARMFANAAIATKAAL